MCSCNIGFPYFGEKGLGLAPDRAPWPLILLSAHPVCASAL
jgi:hypothetical protein